MRCKKQNKTETSGLLKNNWSDSRFRNQEEANDRLKREDKTRSREQVRIFGVLGSKETQSRGPIIPTFDCWVVAELCEVGEKNRRITKTKDFNK